MTRCDNKCVAANPFLFSFGFNDGISEPVVKGINDTGALEQDAIDKNVFLVGKGDSNRSDWMVNGSFMVFRKLEQHVPEWNAAVKAQADKRNISPALFGAKLVGRWPSGMRPLDTSSKTR